MNYNDRNDTYMNANLQNEDVSSGIGLLNSHTIPQYEESSHLNGINTSVENGDVNGDYCYIKIPTGYESKNHNSIYYTKKRYEIAPNIYVMENN